jgi:hypothetical protein
MYLISPSRPASATATALRSFATSMPTNTSLGVVMIRPPMKRIEFYPTPSQSFFVRLEGRFFAPA